MCNRLILSAAILLLYTRGWSGESESTGELLKNGTFEEADGDLPRGWALWVGAVNGNSTKTSEARIDAGGAPGGRTVSLRGAEDTHIWNSLIQSVPVTPGQVLRITGRMKTENVQAVGRQYSNCNLVVIFETGQEGAKPLSIHGTKPRSGTNDWQSLALRVEAPPGSTRARIGCFLSCSGTAWFDDLSARIVEPVRWIKRSGALYDMHSLDAKAVTQADVAANEAACRKAARILGVEVKGRIAYYLYPDLATKEELTGTPGNAHAVSEKQEIHSIFRRDTHEVVHVLTHAWGNPPAILGEGIAVYLAGPWQGTKANRKWVKEFLAENRYLPLEGIVDTRRFRAADDLITYPESGAFVEFLVERHGWPKVRDLYRAAKAGESPQHFERAFSKACGEEFKAAEARFQAWAKTAK